MKKKFVCNACDYPRIAGQAFWEFTCAGCDQKKMHHNTAVPKFCYECCEANNICERCGIPLDKQEATV